MYQRWLSVIEVILPAPDSNEKPAREGAQQKQNPKQRPTEARFGFMFFKAIPADLQCIAGMGSKNI